MFFHTQYIITLKSKKNKNTQNLYQKLNSNFEFTSRDEKHRCCHRNRKLYELFNF